MISITTAFLMILAAVGVGLLVGWIIWGDLVMVEKLLKCPECGSTDVTVSHKQRFMANTGEHYCHSVKTQDGYSEATCLDCGWLGRRDGLVT
jgi:predicted nucleic-acid-binding Zn-ribbon protein